MTPVHLNCFGISTFMVNVHLHSLSFAGRKKQEAFNDIQTNGGGEAVCPTMKNIDSSRQRDLV
jgi:hypothetical protein